MVQNIDDNHNYHIPCSMGWREAANQCLALESLSILLKSAHMGGGHSKSFQSLMFLPCNFQAKEGQAKPNLVTMEK